MITIDLFSGCGGLSLGFQNKGFNIVAAIDNWKPATDVYRKNFDHPIFEVDLNSDEAINLIKNFEPDMIIGGPPCQDFSSAGKRDESLGRADLTIKYASIIANIKPQWFLMENVERILKSNILKESLKIFREANYGLSYKVLDASLCGVPQARKRFFLIGKLSEQDGFLDEILEKNLSKRPMTIFDHLGNTLGLDHYYRHPRSYMRRGIFSIYEPSPTIRGVNRPVPKTYKKHPGDPIELHPNLRPLTTRERSLIQTFPKDFILDGTKTDLEQMIGNAVPVKLAEYVANCIQEYTDSKFVPKNCIQHEQLSLVNFS